MGRGSGIPARPYGSAAAAPGSSTAPPGATASQARPTMDDAATGPNALESNEFARWSPITNTVPAGTTRSIGSLPVGVAVPGGS